MTTRLFQAIELQVGQRILLDEQASHHLAGVLRAKRQDEVILFNGQGGEYQGVITRIEHRRVEVELKSFNPREAESPFKLHLGQGISRGEKMDFTLQKAVELGVTTVTPLLTTRCNVRLIKERFEKKWQHWKKIAIHACEQCGRNRIPDILPPITLTDWLAQVSFEQAFVLDPKATQSLKQSILQKSFVDAVLLVGPEGGLDDDELKLAKEKHFTPISLGPRILRTETAGLAAISALQSLCGDMG